MPIYEYRCQSCRRRVSIYLRDPSSSPECPLCGSEELVRLFSSFAMHRGGYKEIYEDILSDSRLTDGLMRNDPMALAEWNKRMSRGMDEDVSPEYKEMLEKMEHGEMPEELPEGPSMAGEEPG